MRESRSFAQRALATSRPSESAEVRDALGKERQWTGRAAELELRSSDGRRHEALSWTLYQRRCWRSDGASESLVLIFANAVVSIGGSNLQRLSEMIREERLAVVQEQDSAEAALLDAENCGVDPSMRKAVVTEIRIEPSFEDAVEEMQAAGKGAQ